MSSDSEIHIICFVLFWSQILNCKYSFRIVGETLAKLGILQSQRKSSKDIVKKSFTEFKTTIEQTVGIWISKIEW
jgi:hypothetical protein